MSDQNPNNLTDTNPTGAAQLTASGGDAAVAETLSLAELNTYLGKDFKDKATALKAVKDTFSFVGAKSSAASTTVDTALQSKVQSLEEDIFFAQNPQFAEYRDTLKALANGKTLAEASKDSAFTILFDKAKVADEVSKTRSVVASNPRLAETKNAMDEAVRVANATNSTEQTASVLATAIREQMEG